LILILECHIGKRLWGQLGPKNSKIA